MPRSLRLTLVAVKAIDAAIVVRTYLMMLFLPANRGSVYSASPICISLHTMHTMQGRRAPGTGPNRNPIQAVQDDFLSLSIQYIRFLHIRSPRQSCDTTDQTIRPRRISTYPSKQDPEHNVLGTTRRRHPPSGLFIPHPRTRPARLLISLHRSSGLGTG
jgi:hypothetical protein